MRQFLLSFVTLTFVVLGATCITTWFEGVIRAAWARRLAKRPGVMYLVMGCFFMLLAAVTVRFKLNAFVQVIFPGL